MLDTKNKMEISQYINNLETKFVQNFEEIEK